jgi:hypothetical protein
MNHFLALCLAATIICGPTFAKPPRIEVENQMLADTALVDTIYRVKVDSINQATQAKIQAAINRLEKKFDDSKVEEEVGRLIGTYVMEQQLALLDLDIDRAVSLRDTLLLRGLELGLQEWIRNSPQLREVLQKQIEALETKFHMVEVNPLPAKRE